LVAFKSWSLIRVGRLRELVAYEVVALRQNWKRTCNLSNVILLVKSAARTKFLIVTRECTYNCVSMNAIPIKSLFSKFQMYI
jgi:hypothetical protein